MHFWKSRAERSTQARDPLSDNPKKEIFSTNKILSLTHSKILSLFTDSYLCESALSKMNFILNWYRSNLTQLHLEDTLMAVCSSIELDFDKIVDKVDCQMSHLIFIYDLGVSDVSKFCKRDKEWIFFKIFFFPKSAKIPIKHRVYIFFGI